MAKYIYELPIADIKGEDLFTIWVDDGSRPTRDVPYQLQYAQTSIESVANYLQDNLTFPTLSGISPIVVITAGTIDNYVISFSGDTTDNYTTSATLNPITNIIGFTTIEGGSNAYTLDLSSLVTTGTTSLIPLIYSPITATTNSIIPAIGNNSNDSSYSSIFNGDENTITSSSGSTIIGSGNLISGLTNTHIIGGSITATTSDTTYVNSLHIDGRVSLDKGTVSVTTTATTIDLSLGNIFTMALTGSTELDYSNPKVGTYQVLITDQTTGSTLTFTSTKFKAAGGVTPTLTATSGATDMLSMTYDGSDMIVVITSDIQTI